MVALLYVYSNETNPAEIKFFMTASLRSLAVKYPEVITQAKNSSFQFEME